MKQKIYFLSIFVFIFMLNAVANAQGNSNDNKDIKIIYRVKWDGRIIPGISNVSELKRTTDVVAHRSGGDPSNLRMSPGITTYEPIIIQRPRTSDKSFEQWANKVWNLGSGAGSEVSLKDFRKDIRIEICDNSGRILLAFKVYRCWPSEYVALSEYDKEDESVAMEKMVLQHEGWERDYDIK